MHLEDSQYKLRLTTEAFIACNDEILLFQRDTNSKVFPGYWSIPGGHIDINEDPLSACIREIQEETGLIASLDKIRLRYIAFHKHLDRNEIWHIFGFLVEIKKEHMLSATSEGSAKWVPLIKLDEYNLFPPVAYYLGHSLNPKTGLLYSVSEWEKAQLVRIIKEVKDKDY